MSYDLYFQKKNRELFSRQEFVAYFTSRPHYKVENGQALYENDDTGVYFIVEHNEVESLEKTEDPSDYSPANLNLNFLRPHIFALEAEPEITAFVRQFEFIIMDPQIDGNPGTTYEREAFLRGWNAGNKFAFDSIGKSNPEIKTLLYPSDDLERHWNWNFKRNDLQNQLRENIFVPKIAYHSLEGSVKSFIVWSEAIPTAFPTVDTVVVFRQSLAPSKFLRSKQNDFTIRSFSDIGRLLSEEVEYNSLKYRTLASEEKAKEWVISLPASSVKPSPVSVDRVLDFELSQ